METHLISASQSPSPQQRHGGRELISTPHNAALIGASLAISLVQWGVAPWLITWESASGAVVLLASAGLAPFQWALVHESLHGNLLPNAKANAATGRVLCILFGIPFYGLRFGHLAHHRFNRCAVDRPEVHNPVSENWTRAAFRHYSHLFGGMYFGMFLTAFTAWLPRPLVRRIIHRALRRTDPDVARMANLAEAQLAGRFLGAVRADVVCVVALGTGAACSYGAAWPWAVAVFGVRALLVSFSDNSYHYGTAIEARAYARNHSLPRWARGVLLHVNLHRVHHAHPQVPWRALPHWDAAKSEWDGSHFAGMLRQLRGPVPLHKVSSGTA